MPELPEVETTLRGISRYVIGNRVTDVIVYQRQLRWPVSRHLGRSLRNQQIISVKRRAKYLLFETAAGHLIVHLGMSGSLRIVVGETEAKKHDHVDFVLGGKILRFHDPRRFGCILWTRQDPLRHKLLQALGPEPFSDAFNGHYLYKRAATRKVNVKSFIMNSGIVAGVGNIYANEALFASGIHPQRAANRISQSRYEMLADSIKEVLDKAIHSGGTTLRDFLRENGKPGYFAQQLNVYNRSGEPCPVCRKPIQVRMLGQRSSFFCSRCQH
ncbi:MAG: bifunctional DNA-formamidopyrimidine glycosylase/DNA-(apurinic or apyrimidinic site) lyase [Gammaproteobacteria bacterium]|nr:bifunctional DNA-formamidopyrimidine glycosylase/DNA-(apurinic or apyrimidinic site) lyase [Gammaproteobacteria bacterium]